MKISIWKKRYPNWTQINPNKCWDCKYAAKPIHTDARIRCSCHNPITRHDYHEDYSYEEDGTIGYIDISGDGWLCFSFEKKK